MCLWSQQEISNFETVYFSIPSIPGNIGKNWLECLPHEVLFSPIFIATATENVIFSHLLIFANVLPSPKKNTHISAKWLIVDSTFTSPTKGRLNTQRSSSVTGSRSPTSRAAKRVPSGSQSATVATFATSLSASLATSAQNSPEIGMFFRQQNMGNAMFLERHSEKTPFKEIHMEFWLLQFKPDSSGNSLTKQLGRQFWCNEWNQRPAVKGQMPETKKMFGPKQTKLQWNSKWHFVVHGSQNIFPS